MHESPNPLWSLQLCKSVTNFTPFLASLFLILELAPVLKRNGPQIWGSFLWISCFCINFIPIILYSLIGTRYLQAGLIIIIIIPRLFSYCESCLKLLIPPLCRGSLSFSASIFQGCLKSSPFLINREKKKWMFRAGVFCFVVLLIQGKPVLTRHL